MKKCTLIFLLISTLLSFDLFSQILKPVTWETSIIKLNEFEFELVFDATISPEWHLYSQNTPEGGVQPIEFKFEGVKFNYEMIGRTTESPYKIEFNDTFELDEFYFTDKAVFKQKIKIINSELESITVSVSYQACKDQCVQEDKIFKFKLPFKKQLKNTVIDEQKADKSKTNYFTEEKYDYLSKNKTVIKDIETDVKVHSEIGLLNLFFNGSLVVIESLYSFNFIAIILIIFSLFLQMVEVRNSTIMYSKLSMWSLPIIYLAFFILLTLTDGTKSVKEISINLYSNFAVFIIIIYFAISFLNNLRINLIKSLPVDHENNLGKLFFRGSFIFSLGFLLFVLNYSFPFVVVKLDNNLDKFGTKVFFAVMGYYTCAIILVLLIISLLKLLIQNISFGKWIAKNLISVGFLNLFLSIKFLSNSTLIYGIEILDREFFIALWISVLIIWTLYLFGKIPITSAKQSNQISISRLLFGVALLTFTIYLIPGLWGAPLKLIF